MLVAQSLALAALDDLDAAEPRAREAVARSQKTDFLAMRGDALRALADVVARRGRGDEARRLLTRALDLYRRKGHVVAVAQTRAAISACPRGGDRLS
jgi:hypothetical protein